MISFKRTNCAWTLTQYTNSITIEKPISKELQIQDFLVLDFLYQSYSKNIKGVILNEDIDFNRFLQVAGFLSGISTAVQNISVLIICPDENIIKWHYYISKSNCFKVQVLFSDTFEECIKHSGSALLLGFSNVNLVKNFNEKAFFSIVVDDLDLVASKLVLKKLQGAFNIGLTWRNFYNQPDQKLQWNMLNWASPGCVGKLAEFKYLDNDNYANLRDNYKEWWFRLTWNFSDEFVKPSETDSKYVNTLFRKWESEQKLSILVPKKRVNKRKQQVIDTPYNNKEKKNIDKTKKNKDALQVENKNTLASDKIQEVFDTDNGEIVHISANFNTTTDSSDDEILSSLVCGNKKSSQILKTNHENYHETLINNKDVADTLLERNNCYTTNMGVKVKENQFIKSLVEGIQITKHEECSNVEDDGAVDIDQLVADVYALAKKE